MGRLSTSERIQHVKQRLGINSNVRLGTLAGASKSVVGQWISGEIKTIAPQYAFALEEKTSFLAKWIMLGEGPETRQTESASLHEDENIRAVIELMECTTEKTRIEICGIVRNYLINVNSKDETPQKIAGRTGTR